MLKNKKVRSLLQVFLSLGLLIWLINRVGPETILGTLRGLSWSWYIPAFLLFQLNMSIRAFRWYLLVNALDSRPHFGQLVYLYYLGSFFNNFIPSGFGGDIVKVLGLRQKHGHGTEALSTVLMDRLIGLLGTSSIALITLVTGLAAGQKNIRGLPPLLMGTVVIVSAGVPICLALLRLSAPLDWLANRFPFLKRIKGYAKLEKLALTFRKYPRASLVKSLITSLPFTIVLIFIQYCIAQALGVDAAWYFFALFVPIISIVTLLPISFNGLGTREGIFLLLFVPIGVAAGQAISLSIAFYLIRAATGLIGGLLLLLNNLWNALRVPGKHMV